MLLLDVNDRGQDSVRDKVDTVKLRPVHKWLDLEQTFWHLHSNPDEYGTICLDTVSELQQKAVEAVTGWDIGESGTPPTMNQQLWGKVSSLMNTWITQFKSLTDLGIEVVFICQEKYFGGGEDADPELQIDPEIGPRVIPSVADHLEAQCSAILNTFIRRKLTRKRVGKKIKEVGEIQFCVRVGPDPVYVTKMRKPKSIILPDIVVDVEYPDLIKLLKGV